MIELYINQRINQRKFRTKIYSKYFPQDTARDVELNVELSWWQALGVLIVFRILSDWSWSNACIDCMDWSVLNTLCKVIYSFVISVTKLLLGTRAASSLLLLLFFITVEFFDSLLALVALLLDLLALLDFLIVLPGALLDCVTATRLFISIDQFEKKSDWEGNKYSPLLLSCKSQVKCHAYPTVRVVFPVPYLLGVL